MKNVRFAAENPFDELTKLTKLAETCGWTGTPEKFSSGRVVLTICASYAGARVTSSGCDIKTEIFV